MLACGAGVIELLECAIGVDCDTTLNAIMIPDSLRMNPITAPLASDRLPSCRGDKDVVMNSEMFTHILIAVTGNSLAGSAGENKAG